MFDLSDYVCLLLVTVLTVLLYWYSTSSFGYWSKRGVPYIKPLPLFGNIKDQLLNKKPMLEVYHEFYQQLKEHRFGGFYQMKIPTLMVIEPELCERVLVKDFQYFYDRGFHLDPEREPLSVNLPLAEGATWRNLRYKLAPTFTTGKLKGMFDQIKTCSDILVGHVEQESHLGAIDFKTLLGGFTFDVIASCAFGLSFDKNDAMKRKLREIINNVIQPSKLTMFKQMLIVLYSPLAKMLGLKFFSKKVEVLLANLVEETIKYRDENAVNRNDFLQLMLNVRKQEESGKFDRLTEELHPEDEVINQMKHAEVGEGEEEGHKVFMSNAVITANSFVFFLAGSDSVSSAIGLIVYCLTEHPEIQEKVYQEITSVTERHGGKWTYQSVKEMVYLNQVMQEALRLFPLGFVLPRICTKDYRIPGTDVIIEKGTRVSIPVYSIHRDPRYYDSPEKFDPERFAGNNFKPNPRYIPFGDGPRTCIAIRFAILEVQVLLARLISEFKVRLNKKTKTPIRFCNTPNGLNVVGSLWFDFEKRT
uniref:Cytochrome P450 n=1 Tax=Clastoptera arizonana TaxID=38151 RepID=A0A1B6CH33_9HEMI